MKKYIKQFTAFFLILFLILPFTVCSGILSAKAQGNLLVDNADLMTDEEETAVLDSLQSVSDNWNVDVAVLTVNSMDGKDAMTFTDDYYDQHGYAADGVLLMVCMDEREYWISTSGSMISSLTDMGINFIGDNVAGYLSDEDYEGAFTEYASMVNSFIEEYKNTGEAYDTNNLPDDEDFGFNYDGEYADLYEQSGGGFQLLYLLISLVAGCIVSFLIMSVYKGQVKNVHLRGNAGDYLKRDSVNIYTRRDRFLYRNVTKVVKPEPQDNDHGGGSSVHTSGGGGSHGGGGGHF